MTAGLSRPALRVLGIDTSLRCSGVGVVESSGSRLSALYHGCIRNGPKLRHTECLASIQRELRRVIAEFQPGVAAVEGIFFAKNPNTAMVLGQARGVVLACCEEAGLPVYEYPPRRVKQAVVGVGSADKSQMIRMVRSVLGLGEDPQEDAADALGIAICHAHCAHGIQPPTRI